MRLRTLLDVVAVWGLRLAAVVAAPLLLFTARTWHGRAVGVLFGAFWTGAWRVVALDWQARYRGMVPAPTGGWMARPTPFGMPAWVLDVVGVASLLFALAAFLWFLLVVPFLRFTQPAYRSDTPGLRSVVTDEIEGRLVPAGDVSALAAAIAALSNPSARAQWFGYGDAGYERAKGYDHDLMHAQRAAFIAGLSASATRATP